MSLKSILCLLMIFGTAFTNISKGSEQVYSPITVANADSIEMIKRLDLGDRVVQDARFIPNSNLLFALQSDIDSYEGQLHFWDITTFKQHDMGFEDKLQLMTTMISNDGHLLIGGDNNGIVELVDLHSSEVLEPFEVDEADINAIAISDNEKLIGVASGGYGGPYGNYSFSLFEINTRKKLFSLPKCGDPCLGAGVSVAFSPDDRFVAFATTGNNVTLRLLDVATLNQVASIDKHAYRVHDLKFTPDGRYLVFAASDGIRIWDIESSLKSPDVPTFRVIASPDQDEFIQSFDINADGTILAVGYYLHSIRLWDLQTGDMLAELQGHEGRILSVNFNSDDTLLASGSSDGTIRLWGVHY